MKPTVSDPSASTNVPSQLNLTRRVRGDMVVNASSLATRSEPASAFNSEVFPEFV
ncbi:MAG: hypothetical protein Kow0069_32220 [Promethearchaeota archaeon]